MTNFLFSGYSEKKCIRRIEPSREQLEKLQWLSAAERRILNIFDSKLAPEWEIYVKPHMNGARPDFVLLNPHVGIGVFKISENPNPNGQEIQGAKKIAASWKKDILELYCPRLEISPKYGKISSWVAITAGVIFPFSEKQKLPEERFPDYRPVSFKNDIENKYLGKIFPKYSYQTSKFMKPEFAADLRGWLTMPDFTSDSIAALNYRLLDAKQKELINREKTKSGYRRIRGAAGSGKSLILAIRAAKLALEGKKVLIATYNITLWHYLRDLIIRALKAEFENSKKPPAAHKHKIKLSAKSFSEYFSYTNEHRHSPYPQGENYEYQHFNNWGEFFVSDPAQNPLGNITFTHFHYWCKLVCLRTGNIDKYLSLPWRISLEYVLDKALPELVSEIMAQPNYQPQYDAILLDEGQDYQPLWWQALRQDLKPGGEAMLVADRTQNIYEREAWTETMMKKSGFIGRWSVLNISYRMPENLRQLAKIFVRDYIQDPDKILPEAKPQKQGAFAVSNSILRWTQIHNNNAQESCLKEIYYLLQQTGPETKLANADIVICVDNIGFGTALRDAIRKGGNEVYDTFHDSHDGGERAGHEEAKAKKMAFFLEGKTLPSHLNPARLKEGKAAVKITTIHSFKGYEAPIMLLYLENSDPALFYAAFTRIKERDKGSIFSIVCADPNYKKFGEQFPNHGGTFFNKISTGDNYNIDSQHSITVRDIDDEVLF